jgi:membrane protein DedA with SNARE-associated domain
VTKLLLDFGLVLVFLGVAVESAGIPIPGETALIAAAVLARNGRYSVTDVIIVGAMGAIMGDNVGYVLGRVGGRRLLERWDVTARYAARALPPSERFFKRHGSKAVFFGRFVALLRVTSAWLAGISHMPWWKFFVWNAAGGIIWATSISLLAYWAGKAVAEAVGRYGLYGVIALLVVGAIGFFVVRAFRKRMVERA